jgi:hypothetical protein
MRRIDAGRPGDLQVRVAKGIDRNRQSAGAEPVKAASTLPVS